MNTIPTGKFEDVYQSYFLIENNNFALWNSFLLAKKIASNDPRILAEDKTLIAQFVAYLQSTYDALQTGEFSPEELTRRALTMSVYDLIVLLLQVIQESVGVLENNVVFLARYQREYATIMGRIADQFYMGKSLSLPEPNMNDFTQWRLGYGKVTMDEYLTAAVAKMSGPTEENVPDPAGIRLDSIAVEPAPQDVGKVALGIGTAILEDKLPGKATKNQLRMVGTDTGITFTFTYQQYIPPTDEEEAKFLPVVVTGSYAYPGPNTSFEDKLNFARNSFTQFLSQPVGNLGITVYQGIANDQLPKTEPYFDKPLNRILTLPWSRDYNLPYTPTTDSEDSARQSSASQRRGDKNSLLKQFVQNEQTRRQVIGNQSDAETNTVQQAQTGINQGSEILAATIRQLSSILTSIFQIAK